MCVVGLQMLFWDWEFYMCAVCYMCLCVCGGEYCEVFSLLSQLRMMLTTSSISALFSELPSLRLSFSGHVH